MIHSCYCRQQFITDTPKEEKLCAKCKVTVPEATIAPNRNLVYIGRKCELCGKKIYKVKKNSAIRFCTPCSVVNARRKTKLYTQKQKANTAAKSAA